MSRVDRVAERIKADVSDIIRKHIDDPRIGFITITNVSVSPDLEDARIFVSVLGTEEQKQETMKGLFSAQKVIRMRLGDKLQLRTVPEISFVLDESIEKASRIWNKMNEIK